MMKSPQDSDREPQQSQSVSLSSQYRTIGIPAVSAATLFKAKRDQKPLARPVFDDRDDG